jgi:hypothetical protein
MTTASLGRSQRVVTTPRTFSYRAKGLSSSSLAPSRRDVWLPSLVGIGSGAIAYGIAQLGLEQFVACLLAGLASCVVIGLLLLHHRRELARLRRVEASV